MAQQTDNLKALEQTDNLKALEQTDNLKALEQTGNLKALEQTHVYDIYNEMAPRVCEIWHKAWPNVKHFMKDLEPGALVADVGCGSGRYLKINKSTFKMGSDICVPLVNNARHRGYEVMVCDNLNLPYRDCVFDAVISIGVIHHFTTTERRLQAMKELARILRPGGKLMLYVWAYEQKHRKFDSQEVLIPWKFQTKHGIKSGSKLIKYSSIERDFSSTSSISSDDVSGDGQENSYNPDSLDNDICNNTLHRNTHESLGFVEELQQLGAKLKALTQTPSLRFQANGSCDNLKSLKPSADVNCKSGESNNDLKQSIENEQPLSVTTVQNGRLRKQLHKQKCLQDQAILTKSLSDFMSAKTGSPPAVSYTKSISYSYSDLCDSETNPGPQDTNSGTEDFQFPTLQEFKNGICEFFGLKKKSTKNHKKVLDNGMPFNAKFNNLLESSLRYHSLPEGDFFAVREFPQSSHPAFRKHLSFTVGDSVAITESLAQADELPDLSSLLLTEVKSSDYMTVMESTTKTQSDNGIENLQSKSEKAGNNHHRHNGARHLEYKSNKQSAKCIIGLHHKKDSNELCAHDADSPNYTNPTMPVYNHEKNSIENNSLYQVSLGVSETKSVVSSGLDKKCICSINDQCANDMNSGDSRYRYYHVFRQGELQQLIGKNISSLEIIQTSYDHANWCVIAEKKSTKHL